MICDVNYFQREVRENPKFRALLAASWPVKPVKLPKQRRTFRVMQEFAAFLRQTGNAEFGPLEVVKFFTERGWKVHQPKQNASALLGKMLARKVVRLNRVRGQYKFYRASSPRAADRVAAMV